MQAGSFIIVQQEVSKFAVARNITDDNLFNPYSVAPYTSIKTLA